jgi:hypothetical protein
MEKLSGMLAVSLLIAVSFFSFQQEEQASGTIRKPLVFKSDSSVDGKKLALIHCQGCHAFPEPELLDKQTWVTSVLPAMGLRLGVRESGKDPFEDLDPREADILRNLNVYPEEQVISQSDWNRIVQYFEQNAPEKPLPQKARNAIESGLPQFKANTLQFEGRTIPKTTLLKYDATSGSLYVGDAEKELYVLNKEFQVKDMWWTDTPPVDIDFPKNAPPRLLTIGLFKPSDQKLGRLMSLAKSNQSPESQINIPNLPRPVQFAAGDLNGDGKEDAVICGFGNHSGKLFWLDAFNPNKEHMLKPLPGARKVEIEDLNKDKKPDIVALMAQAREEISIFYNKGNGTFKEKTVLRFSPLFGASYFELADFNKDGFQDILVTNGDNWDVSPIDKNYHGVRIYLNDGKDNFREAWFYPLYGASKAIARDFDNDGDLDIAVTSFYSDSEKPEHGFVYLANEGKLNFKAYSAPEAALGKWLTMEAADVDGDGDIDIILGSYFHSVLEVSKLAIRGVESFPQLLILQNQQK